MVDTSSPGFVVQVLAQSPDGRLAPSWTAGDVTRAFQSPGTLLSRMKDISERVTRFEYSDEERSIGELKLTIDNWDLTFLDHPAFIKGNLVRVVWGYGTGIQGPKYMVVDSFRGFRTLTVSCLGREALANDGHVDFWPNTTRYQIVAQLVSRGAFPGVTKLALGDGAPVDARSLVAATVLTGVASSPFFSGPLPEKARDYNQAGLTDWEFCKRLAEEIDHDVYVEDDVFRFHPRRLGEVPIREYEWYTGNGDFIDFQITEYRSLDRPLSIRVSARDPISRENIDATGSDKTTQRDTLGDQGVAAQTTTIKTLTLPGESQAFLSGSRVITSPQPDAATIQNQADSTFRDFENGEVEATAIVVGDPRLRAMRLIKLKNISRTLEGNYYIRKVDHEISPGGTSGTYHCKLKLFRNAVKAQATEGPPDLDPSKAKDNDKGPIAGRAKVLVLDSQTDTLQYVDPASRK